MVPPTPAFPKFANNSLLLDTTPDFGPDDTLGDILGPGSSSYADIFTPTPLPSAHLPSPEIARAATGRILPPSLTDSVHVIRDDFEDGAEELSLSYIGSGERIVAETSASGFARSQSRSISPAVSVQRKTDDYYARRLSTSRPASPFINTTILPASPFLGTSVLGRSTTSSNLGRSISATRRLSSSASVTSIDTSDEEPSRVQFAWRSKPPMAERDRAQQPTTSAESARQAIQPSISPTVILKPKASKLGRYLAKAAVLRAETCSTTPASEASTGLSASSELSPALSASESTSAHGTAEQSAEVDPEPVALPFAGPLTDLQPAIVNAETANVAEPSDTSPSAEASLPCGSTDLFPRSPTPQPVLPLSKSTTSPSLARSTSIRPLTPPLLPISDVLGSTTTPYGIPMPTLVDLEDESDMSLEHGNGEDVKDSARDEGAQTKTKSRPRSSLVEFFTGFLRGSTSSRPNAEDITPADTGPAATETEVPVLSAEMPKADTVPAVVSPPFAMVPVKIAPVQPESSGPTKKPPTAPARKTPIPGYVPLTRPSHAKPAPTVASSSRALQPSRTQHSATSNNSARPALNAATKPTSSAPEKTARKPPLPSFQRPTASSEFAKAALAKLPPPGKGSTAASKPVRVRTPERAHNIASRRKVFEQPASFNPPPPRTSATNAITRTIPLVGRTPGKASRARAAAREEYEQALKQRQEEKEAKRREEVRRKMEEEEKEYQRKRKETVIWAKPVPELYHRKVKSSTA